MHKGGYRQIEPAAFPVKVEPLAQEIADLIINRVQDSRLDWKPDGTARIRIDQILPSRGVKQQTLTGRRKRLHKALHDLLSQKGWKTIKPNHCGPS